MNDRFESERAPAQSTLEFLSGSPHRVGILYLLCEEGSATRRDVRESVDASRSTVRRTLEGLLERDWIAPTDDGYRLTAAGRLVAEAFEGLSTAVGVADEYAPLLRHLPGTAFDVDPAWLEGGSLTVATDADPYAPALRQTETVRAAGRFRALLPSIELEGTKLVHERVTDGDLRGAIVLSAAGAETVRSDPFADHFGEMLATGRLDVFAHDADLPLYLGLADADRVEVGCENDAGIPHALLQSTDADLRRWGERTFDRYVESAERLTESDF